MQGNIEEYKYDNWILKSPNLYFKLIVESFNIVVRVLWNYFKDAFKPHGSYVPKRPHEE